MSMPSSGNCWASLVRYWSRTCVGSVNKMSRRAISGFQSQQSRGIVETNILAQVLGKRHAVDERGRLFRGLERVVGGEHHAIGAERADRADQRIGGAHARCRDHEIVLEVLRR